MDGLTLTITISSILIGIFVTFFVAKYYFKKGDKKKSLTPYLQFSSTLFQELDPELRQSLIVKYKDVNIENLTQAQFLIANTGDLPIRDIIEDFKLTLPKENKIFSISIIHIQPEGRNIEYKIEENNDKNIVLFKIPLLNKGEFFVFKVLYQDFITDDKDTKDVEYDEEYSFTITAYNLPPNLELEHLPFNYYEDEIDNKYDWSSFWIAFISGIVFGSILLTILAFDEPVNNRYLFNFKSFFSSDTFDFINIGILFLSLLGFVTFLLTILGIVMALSELSPDDKPKFKVPTKLRKEKKYYLFNE